MNISNPTTEVILATVTEDTPQLIQEKYERARQAQPAWAKVPLPERIQIIRRFYELLDEHTEALAHVLTSEMGKPLQQARNEIKAARGRIAFFLENSEKWLTEEVIHAGEGLQEKIAYEPLGVIANISAWNYPYLVGVNVYIPALIAGNAVLYKPSEYTTLTGEKVGELMRKAGVPLDVFQLIIGRGAAGQALLELPLNGYFFTGSYKTGKYIYETVAPKMVPCQLELGGKDPLYVPDDSADVQKVARAAADGAFYNNGQSCCAVERIYVHQNLYDAFVEEFVKEVKSYQLGDPTEEGVYFGPLARKEQLDVLAGQVEDAVAKGAEVLTGGKKKESKGYYFEPTVLVNVNHSMQVMQEESFGPIIGIQKVQGDAEAIALMQDTAYGLTAAVYADHEATATQILSQINTGSAYWNCCDRVSANLPWSGRGHSGIGATLSYLGIRTFVQPKAYHLKA